MSRSAGGWSGGRGSTYISLWGLTGVLVWWWWGDEQELKKHLCAPIYLFFFLFSLFWYERPVFLTLIFFFPFLDDWGCLLVTNGVRSEMADSKVEHFFVFFLFWAAVPKSKTSLGGKKNKSNGLWLKRSLPSVLAAQLVTMGTDWRRSHPSLKWSDIIHVCFKKRCFHSFITLKSKSGNTPDSTNKEWTKALVHPLILLYMSPTSHGSWCAGRAGTPAQEVKKFLGRRVWI